MKQQVVTDEFRGLKSKVAVVLATVSTVLLIMAANRILVYEAYTSDDFNGLVDKKRIVSILTTNFILLLVFVALALAGLVFVVYFSGKYTEKGKVKLNLLDRVFPELRLLAIFALGVGIIMAENMYFRYLSSGATLERILKTIAKGQVVTQEFRDKTFEVMGRGYEFRPEWGEGFATIAAMTLFIFCAIILLQSLVKNIKNNDLFERSIVGKILISIHNAIISKDVTIKKLYLGFVLLLPTLIWHWWAIIALLIAIVYVPRCYNDYAMVRSGIRAIKDGDFNQKVVVRHKGEFERLAGDINDIAKAEEIALENELRSQRLRNELISNVSHDLKTPLTSMVTYIDLLKLQGLDSPDAMSYLEIIEQKTKRLQKLSGDLFEATKASSGAMPINIEVIDLNGVAQQAIGELSDLLVSSNIEVHFENNQEHVFVNADGKMLWRVIENLLTNVSKYSLPGTRAYVKVREMGKFAALEISNVSKDALDIDPDELMERFKRGDKSRNTEGSGLGLAIARDLMHMMNGDIRLGIDGDLFKARVLVSRVGQ